VSPPVAPPPLPGSVVVPLDEASVRQAVAELLDDPR